MKKIYELIGFSCALSSMIWMIITTISLIMFGGIVFYEPNILISIIEFISVLIGSAYIIKKRFDD